MKAPGLTTIRYSLYYLLSFYGLMASACLTLSFPIADIGDTKYQHHSLQTLAFLHTDTLIWNDRTISLSRRSRTLRTHAIKRNALSRPFLMANTQLDKSQSHNTSKFKHAEGRTKLFGRFSPKAWSDAKACETYATC